MLAQPHAPAPNRSLRRLGEGAAAALGLLCCVATSAPDEGPTPLNDTAGETEGDSEQGQGADAPADVYVHNALDREVVVRVRLLKPAVDLDCAVVAEDPGTRLTAELFASGSAWTAAPGVNVPLTAGAGGRTCFAALIGVDGFVPTVAFWYAGQPAWQSTAVEGLDTNPDGAIVLGTQSDGRGRFNTSGPVVLSPLTALPKPSEQCEAFDDGQRFAWSRPVPSGDMRLLSVQAGLDGCLELGLADTAGAAAEPWYFCVDQDAFPFVPDEVIRVESVFSGGAVAVQLSVVDDATVLPWPRMYVGRGAAAPAFAGLSMTVEPRAECGFESVACGTLVQVGEAHLSSSNFGQAVVTSAEPVSMFGLEGETLRVEARGILLRSVLDPECSSGSDVLGADVEFSLTVRGPQ